MTSFQNSTRGILHAEEGRKKFTLARFEASPAVQPFVEHYWIVRYDLSDQPSYTQTILSFPNVNLAFEHDVVGRRVLVYGIPQRPFERTLTGEGKVLGIKFKAGGFFPFWQQDVSELTGKTVPASDVFGPGINRRVDAVLDADSDEAMVEQAEHVLSESLPERDARAELAGRMVHETMIDRKIYKVEHLCERFGFSKRHLQRLFRQYIGVTPKWVIKRFRLQEAAECLERGETEQWTELAGRLGYYDQAHFINDFKSVLGQSPTAYKQKFAP